METAFTAGKKNRNTLVMQGFRVEYHVISHKSLVFSRYTRALFYTTPHDMRTRWNG